MSIDTKTAMICWGDDADGKACNYLIALIHRWVQLQFWVHTVLPQSLRRFDITNTQEPHMSDWVK